MSILLPVVKRGRTACCKAAIVCCHPDEWHHHSECYQPSCYKCGKDVSK